MGRSAPIPRNTRAPAGVIRISTILPMNSRTPHARLHPLRPPPEQPRAAPARSRACAGRARAPTTSPSAGPADRGRRLTRRSRPPARRAGTVRGRLPDPLIAAAVDPVPSRRLGWRRMNGDPWRGRRLHFVGIGGAGMSGLAIVARELGAQVSGSDRAPDSPYLARTGLTAVPHDAANVPDGAELVFSSAIPPDNPERAAARERGLRELHRADLLGEITRLRPTIAITGTHGKTTTSSMVVHALRGCGMDPGYLVGGEVRSTGSNAGWGAGRVARGRGRRVRPLAAQARAADRRAHERRARPPRDLRLAARRRRHLPRLPAIGGRCGARRRARPRALPGPGGAAGARAARAGRLAVLVRRRAGRARGAGRAQRAQRGVCPGRVRARRGRPRLPPPPRSPASGAPGGGSSGSA